MATNTATWALTYPQSTDDVRPYEDIQELATDTDTALTTLKGQVPVLKARASRTTTGTVTTTTKQGYLRIDNIAIVSGQAYRIWTTPMIMNSTVAADLINVYMHVSTSGAATTSSTQLTCLVTPSKSASASQATAEMSALYVASTTGNLSVLLCYNRGSGSGSVNIVAASDFPVQLNVDAYNQAAPADTGVSI